jgi:excinuclease ABC subunit B
MSEFDLKSRYSPAGDQPKAIETLLNTYAEGEQSQVLLGVTGSGKTFTVANVLKELNKPTLILTHNKTLAAQLYEEFSEFFPNNAVEYFVSYYDYYQPEAYVVASDTFIEKDSSINDEIDKLRMRTTTSLLTRKDVIVIASVSCIYGLGSPQEFQDMMVRLKVGDEIERDELLKRLVDIQYRRNDMVIERGCFRVRGDVIEIQPSYEDYAFRIELFGDELEGFFKIDVLTGEVLETPSELVIAPARHFVTREENMGRITKDLEEELEGQLKVFQEEGKLVEAQRLEQRVKHDIEMLKETGYCSGIENYSRVVENREAGSRPYTLLDFFGEDWLLVVDESHVSIPQIGGMFGGDQARKRNLVDYGFRLPCAMDNRPMSFKEFEFKNPPQVMYVSATPGKYEMEATEGVVVEQIIRPTGLLDPEVEICPIEGQMDRLVDDIRMVTARGERILVTTLTKKMSEDLTNFLNELGIKVRYLHSDIDTLERTEILRDLRRGIFDVLIGINLLREGLDLPEVSLVAILDADKEGFLRSYRSLIQTMGRAARNVNGKVLLFMDRWTDSIRLAVGETQRRREVQIAHNLEHGITPQNVVRSITESIKIEGPEGEEESKAKKSKKGFVTTEKADIKLSLEEMKQKMKDAALELRFEDAAMWRDKIESFDS